MISMKDIAAICHVSVATVSKALNNHTDISEETKKMIQQKANELGYFPNPAARALKTHSTYNIGVLFYDEANSGLTHEYFSSVLEAVKNTAERRGYDVTFISHFVGGRRMTYCEHSRYRNVDGVVIVCTDFRDPEVAELIHSDIPVVTIDHTFDSCSAIMSDNVKGMSDLVHHIYEKGHRRVGFIHGAASSVTDYRLASFYRTASQLGLSIPDDYVVECAYHDTEMANRRTRELMKLKNPPTCILYPDDITAISGINELRQMGYRVPEDVSVVGFDGITIGQSLDPKLTTLRQDAQTIGSSAADQLINQIEHPKTTIKQIVTVSGEVLAGASLADLRK
ncbi:MAG: LacI family DNA-binding transcriptional regulator [Lachnospiraceae bacterium]|nr:LacI family DNA-binding transcriptional regulator [Lachnospiraceae bacterium]